MAEESVDRLYILIEAQAKGCADIELEGLKHGLIMHTKNVHKFCELLKNATYPEGVVHPIFSAIVEKVSANANATGENKKKYFSLPELWNEMDSCFTTSHERKFMCFQVFQLMLPSITHIEIPQIMTPNFLKCYINTLSNKKSVLFPQATSVTKSLVSAAQDSKVGLGSVMALMNNKLFTFDALTKTKTVENILSNLDVAAMEEYTAHLIMVSAESDQLASWAAEQMATLVRNGVIIKHEAYISSIVTHLVTKGFFVESPASSTIREKLLSVLGSLGNVSLGYIKNTSSTPEEQKKAAVIAKKTMGKMNNGKSWFTFALEKFTATKESIKPVVALDEESQTAVDSCLAAINSLEKKEGADKDAMTALLTLTVLEMHHVSSSETATDLAEVTLRIFASKSKKRKTTEPEALEVLVDTLLALLAKDSAVVRHLATEVFKAFVDRIGTAGVDLCFGVLNAGEGAAGHDELFDEEDGDHASDDDSDSGSDDSEEDVIMEVGDERIGAENDKLTDSVIAAIKEAQSGNADEEEPELPDLNDEEMTAFDAHLSNIFAQKKTIAKEKKQTKVTVLHFKLRALDIVEEFVKAGRHCFYIMKLLVPLYAALATSRDNLSLHTKIGSVLLKLSKEKREIGVESKDAAEMLESIHTRFKKCSLPMLKIYSSLSLFVVRALLEEKPDSQKPVKDINVRSN
jgi:DNA polymerase phi